MDIVRRHRESLKSVESVTLSTPEDSGTPEVSKLSTQPVEPWNDPEQFFKEMKDAGWTWPRVVAWLKVSTSVGFFEVHPNDRHRAYDEFSKSR